MITKTKEEPGLEKSKIIKNRKKFSISIFNVEEFSNNIYIYNNNK